MWPCRFSLQGRTTPSSILFRTPISTTFFPRVQSGIRAPPFSLRPARRMHQLKGTKGATSEKTSGSLILGGCGIRRVRLRCCPPRGAIFTRSSAPEEVKAAKIKWWNRHERPCGNRRGTPVKPYSPRSCLKQRPRRDALAGRAGILPPSGSVPVSHFQTWSGGQLLLCFSFSISSTCR